MEFRRLVQMGCLVVSFAAWGSSSPALGHPSSSSTHGVRDGGGGDLLPDDFGSAWFLGGQPIHYCIQISSDFGLGSSDVQSSINWAVAQWQQYVSSRDIWGQSRLDLNYVRIPQCDGTEDVQFLFGVMNDSVARARAGFVDPSFFAYRSAYDAQKGWGKGIIWVGGPSVVHLGNLGTQWTVGLLETALLHELGHVLGCAHVDGTIMRQSIAKEFNEAETIDQERMLAIGSGAMRYTTSYAPDIEGMGDTFKKITGSDPQGSIKSEITFSVSQSLPAQVTLSSGSVSKIVSFEPMKGAAPVSMASSFYDVGAPAIFKYSYHGDTQSYSPFGGVIYGTVRDAAGNTLFATLEINMNSPHATLGSISSEGPVGLYYFDKGIKSALYF